VGGLAIGTNGYLTLNANPGQQVPDITTTGAFSFGGTIQIKVPTSGDYTLFSFIPLIQASTMNFTQSPYDPSKFGGGNFGTGSINAPMVGTDFLVPEIRQETVNGSSAYVLGLEVDRPFAPMPLFTAQQKAQFGNVAAVTGAVGEAISLGDFAFGAVEMGTFDALKYLSVAAGSPAAAKILAKQVADNVNVGLAVLGEALGCFTPEVAQAVACAVATLGLGLTVTNVLASDIKADPPDPNYQTVFTPNIETSPVPLTGPCLPLTTAATAAPFALDQMNGRLEALDITQNRYSTAVSAGDTASATMQAAAFQTDMASYTVAAKTAQADLVSYGPTLLACCVELHGLLNPIKS